MTLSEAALEALARGALSPAHPAGARVLSARPDRWVVAFDRERVVVKAYRRRTGLRGLLDVLFGDRARRTVDASRLARRRGLPVAAALAYVRGPAGAAVALELIREGRGARAAHAEARTVAERRAREAAVAGLLRAIHDARLYHADFHEGNVLFGEDASPFLIDLDGLRRVAFVSKRRRVRNLERLLRDFLGAQRVSRSTRLRFLVAYAGSRTEARALWRAIDRRSAAKRAQYGLPSP